MLPVRRHLIQVTPTRKHAVPVLSGTGFGRFSSALERAVLIKNETVWMFDNEIDWVTRLERPLSAVRRRDGDSLQTRLNTRPSTCKELLQVSNSGKCSSKK